MATITLSKTGNQYLLAVNGWSKTKNLINITVLATDQTIEEAQDAFSGNEEIIMRDASIHITAQGYVYCRSIERIADYPVGGMDAHGDDVLMDVWKIVLADEEQTEEVEREELSAEQDQIEAEEQVEEEEQAEEAE